MVFRRNAIPAIVLAIMIGVTVIGVFGDRTQPRTLISYTIDPPVVANGQTVDQVLTVKDTSTRACPGINHLWMEDASGRSTNLLVYPPRRPLRIFRSARRILSVVL